MKESSGHDSAQAAMDAVLDVARRLGRSFDLIEVLQQVIEAGRVALRAERGSVFLLDRERNELYTKVGTGDPEIRLRIDQGIVGQCASTRQIINVPDCAADPRFATAVDQSTGFRTRSLIALPLIGMDDEVAGVLELLNPAHGAFQEMDVQFADALAVQAAIAIQKAQWMEDRLVKAKMERDLDLARRIQQSALPQQLPAVKGYDLAAMTRPADETGGDVYDLMTMPEDPAGGATGKTLFLLADVAGHGIGPALAAMSLRAMIRIGARLGASLDELLTQVANQVIQDLNSERFITMFLGVLDPAQNRLDYHSAGQGPIGIYHADGQHVEWRQASMLPLGVMPGEHTKNDGVQSIAFGPGDILLLLTDGFYEYNDPTREQWGCLPAAELLMRRHDESAADLLRMMRRDVETFAKGAPQRDDITGIVLKRLA